MKKVSGFTLIELMVVITIIGILSAVTILGLTSVQQKAQDTGYLSQIRDVQLALAAYKSVNNTYPANITDLVPNFTKDIPTISAFHYSVSSNKKTYCVFFVGVITAPSSQPTLATDCQKTWAACEGPDYQTLENCSAYTSSGNSGNSDLDNY